MFYGVTKGRASLLLASASAALLGSAVANEAGSSAAFETEDVIVVRGDYQAAEVTSATKTPTLLVNVPQSVTVLSTQQIEDQAFTQLGDVLQFVPGVSIGQGEGHRDQITIRGQNTTADFFVDGLRDDVQYFRPLYNLERIEVLKGANALAFGRGGGGGVVNRVTKTPFVEASALEASLAGNTFGAALASVDANLAFGEKSALRLNAFAEHLENHRDVFEGNRQALNPTLLFAPSPRTEMLLSYEYVRDERVVDRGVPSLNGEPVRGYDDTFFGSAEANETMLTAHIVRARIEHEMADDWKADATVQLADYDKLYQNLYPIGFDPAGGTVSLDGYRDATDRRNLIVQANLIGGFATGPVDHRIVVGAEFADQDTANDRRDAFFDASGDDQVTFAFTDPLAVPAFSFPTVSRDRASDVEAASVYVQDQIDIGAQLKLVGGLRYDRFDIAASDLTDLEAGDRVRVDEEVSPRLGLIYKPVPVASIYASYSRSFLPRSGDQFLTLDASDAALDPESFQNLELGFKWDLRRDLALTAAVFRLERDSGTILDPDDPERTILIGSVTEGAEIGLVGRLLSRWTVNAGYSYLEAEEDGRIVEGLEADRTLPQVPRHMASLWNRFDVTDRLSLGAGLHHQSSQSVTIGDAVTLPAYTRIDAAAYYALTGAVTLQLNVENVTDEDYFPSAHNDDNISTGAPINARFTLRSVF